jgi:Holliday junction resolvasome RuvABC DNA-binding subunit
MQCSFIGKDGERCSSRELLELDHRTPQARGGTGDPTNVRILCKAHNLYEAEQAFGRAHIDSFRRERRPDPRDRVRGALRSLGFRSAEAERAVTALDAHGWSDRPIEALMRDAIGVIT